jgi:hypothetical protein
MVAAGQDDDSVALAEEEGRSKRRKLRRNWTHEVSDVEVSNVPCIRGGVRRDWLVLPLEDVHGESCCFITMRKCWLHQLLTGYNSGDHTAAVTNFLTECIKAFRSSKGSEEGCKPIREELVSTAASQADTGNADDAQGAAPKAEELLPEGKSNKGRRAILSSDSEDAGSDAPKPRRRLKAKKDSHRAIKRWDMVTLTVRGFPLTFSVAEGPRLVIPVSGENLQNIVKDLQPRGGESLMICAQDDRQHNTPASLLREEDKGRIMYRRACRTTKAAFIVSFTDQHGRARTSRAGLLLHSDDVDGKPLASEAFMATAKTTLQRARHEWNRLNPSLEFKFPA